MIWRLIALLVLIVTVMALGASAQTKYPVPLVNMLLVPDATTPGGHGFTLTVNGSGFTPASVVKWNARARKTTFVSDIQLTARIRASDIAVASTAAVTVSTPGMHHTSNPVNFQVASPEQECLRQVVGNVLTWSSILD